MSARPLASLARDVHLYLALAAGIVVWILLAQTIAVRGDFALRKPLEFFAAVVLYPIAEELIFRGWIQPAIAARMPFRALPGVSAANFVTSTLFAIAHLAFHPAPAALATFFPSIVFGHFRDRYASVVPCILLHAFYNAGYFLLFG